jgi:uncharacterized protein Yka (UPF0111/DUF47 family)
MRWRRPTPDPELFRLIEAYGAMLQRASGLVSDLFAELPEQLPLTADVHAVEHDADALAHDILRRVAVLDGHNPDDPRDIHALVKALDDVVDYADEAADLLSLYSVEAPMESAQEMTVILHACTGQLAAALGALRAQQPLDGYLEEIRRLEKEGDRTDRAGVAALFEFGIDPMVVIRWKDIYETLESAIDACATAANVLEGMMLRRARS